MRIFRSCALASLIFVMGVVAAPAANLEIHFVDVGQGDCTVISCPNGTTILVDCGNGYSCSRTNLTDYVSSILNTQLHALIITHQDTDHYGLVQESVAAIDQENKSGTDFTISVAASRESIDETKSVADQLVTHILAQLNASTEKH